MVKCKKCGKEIGDKNFCPDCGTKNEIELCPSCNAELEEDAVFCPNCGEKIKEDEETVEEEETTEDKTEESKESVGEEETTEDKTEESEEKSNDKKEKEETSKDDYEKEENAIRCPHCNTKLYDADVEYCPECGKAINIDIQSFEGIKTTIQTKKVIVFSIISIIFSAALSLLLSFVFGMMSQTTDLYPIGFFISLLIVIGIFGSFKDLINGGLLGIITGLALGLLSSIIVELSGGFTFSYQMFSGYAPIIFTIFGAIIGVISTKYLRKSVLKYIDVEKLL